MLVKDNHIALAGGIGEAVRRALARRPPGVPVEVECGSLADVEEALEAGADAPAARQHGPGPAARGGGAGRPGARSSRPRAASPRRRSRSVAGLWRTIRCHWVPDPFRARARPLDVRRTASSRPMKPLPTLQPQRGRRRPARDRGHPRDAARGARARRRAQRRDPGPQLPAARGPGRRRLRGRLARAVPPGGRHRRRRDRLLRRPLHGRDGVDPLARQDGPDPRPRRRLLAVGLDHGRPAARLEGASTRARSWSCT